MATCLGLNNPCLGPHHPSVAISRRAIQESTDIAHRAAMMSYVSYRHPPLGEAARGRATPKKQKRDCCRAMKHRPAQRSPSTINRNKKNEQRPNWLSSRLKESARTCTFTRILDIVSRLHQPSRNARKHDPHRALYPVQTYACTERSSCTRSRYDSWS